MTHEELVEKVAATISGAPFPSPVMKTKARRAIAAVYAALSEPTPRMVSEGESAASYGIGRVRDGEAIPRVYRAMLAAAPLNPGAKS